LAYLSWGPHLQAALLCQQVTQQVPNGPITIVGLIDRVVVRVPRGIPPEQVAPSVVSCHAVVILKSGSRPGRHKLRLTLTSPSGIPIREFSLDITLPDEPDQGVNVVMPIQFTASEEGIYWFDVNLDLNTLPLTRISFRRLVQRT
jgi:hypothetical protein